MTGSARESLSRAGVLRLPWPAAQPCQSERLAQGARPAASGHLGPPPYRERVAAGYPGDAEPAHPISPSLAPPGKLCPGPDPSPVLTTQHTQHWSTPIQVSPPFPFPVGLSPWHRAHIPSHPSLWMFVPSQSGPTGTAWQGGTQLPSAAERDAAGWG